MSPRATLVWFRRDLRLSDNPALWEATKRGRPIIPVFIYSPEQEGEWAIGGAARYWLHQSLLSLDRNLHEKGSRLILRRGDSLKEMLILVDETSADAVFWNRRYEPAAVSNDSALKEALLRRGVHVQTGNASLLFEPWDVLTSQGSPYQVFTPYWKACRSNLEPADPLPSPGILPAPIRWPSSSALNDFQLEPSVDRANEFRKAWSFGEEGAQGRLEDFLQSGIGRYDEARDRPDLPGVSRLSPYLHHGEVGPRQVWQAVKNRYAGRRSRRHGEKSPASGEGYLRQLVWREFAYHSLYHFPHMSSEPLRESFRRFPWASHPELLCAWQQGQTGYPFVDAGMRELRATGWMHNRVRMVAASFLVKDLLIRWQEGANWFWATLVDADLANNSFGWQWSAGCGADSAPYFRVFNPVLQGERFDPEGAYVRRWVPELSQMPLKWLHKPWRAPETVLKGAGVHPGKNYPLPLVDHDAARERALAAYAETKGSLK